MRKVPLKRFIPARKLRLMLRQPLMLHQNASCCIKTPHAASKHLMLQQNTSCCIKTPHAASNHLMLHQITSCSMMSVRRRYVHAPFCPNFTHYFKYFSTRSTRPNFATNTSNKFLSRIEFFRLSARLF